MRIACVATGWYPQTAGGLEKYVYGMARQLTSDGDDVDLFVTGDPEPWSPRSRVHRLADPAGSLAGRARAARRCLATHYREPYDVLDLHFAMNALPLASLVRKTTPRVFHFHGPWSAESRAEGGGRLAGAIKYALERLVYERVDRFITLSTAFKDVLTGTYGVAPDRVRVIPMGIDTEFFAPAADRPIRTPEPARHLTVFTARRLIRRVGLFELIEAVARVPDHARRLRVRIAGRGPLEAELRRAVAAHGLGDTVELCGFLSEADLVRAYQHADLTVLPSQALEGFGTVISESLACGTPVMVTPVGGMPEAVARFSPQLIAPAATPEALAAMLDAIAAGRLPLPARSAARAYAVAEYAWPIVARRIRDVFAAAGADRRDRMRAAG